MPSLLSLLQGLFSFIINLVLGLFTGLLGSFIPV